MSNPVSKDAVSPSSVSSGGEGPGPFVQEFRGSGARFDRRRVRRYRHKPALRVEDSARPAGRGRARPASGHRRRLAHHLGAAARRHREIRAVPDAGGQQGRGRQRYRLWRSRRMPLGRRTTIVFLLGVAGAALFSGDAIITPAISVLSALEGLKQVDADLARYVLPATIVILVLLFTAQSREPPALRPSSARSW